MKALPEALRTLPLRAPERSAWPELAARLARDAAPAHAPAIAAAGRRANGRIALRRWTMPLALAAALLLAIGGVQLLRTRPTPASATIAHAAASSTASAANPTDATKGTNVPSGNAGQLAALQQRSQALEHWLHETARAGAPLPGQDLAAATEIEDMIGLVDLQLGAGTRSAEVGLWQRRVALLEDLTALRYTSYSLAENGVAARAPVNWTN
jgi:hypothetical protein